MDSNNFIEPKNGVRSKEPVLEPGSEIFYNRPILYGNEKTVEIGYTSASGDVYLKTVNVPYNSDGEIDQTTFDQIVDDHSRALRRKISLGTISALEDAGNPEDR